MNTHQNQSKSQGNRVWVALGLRSSWNWRFALFAFVAYAIAAVAFDNIRLANFSVIWILIDLGTFLEALLLILVALRFLPSFAWETPTVGRVTNFLLAGVVGAVKNTSVYLIASSLALDSTPWDGVTRIVGGAALSAGTFVLWVSYTSSRSSHSRIMEELIESRNQLIAIREKVSLQALEAQNELVLQTKSAILPKLKLIQEYLAQDPDAGQVVESLQALAEFEVRPLSRQFQAAAERLAATPAPEKNEFTRNLGFPEKFDLRSNINPLMISGLLIPAQLLSFNTLNGPDLIWSLMPSIAITVATVFGAKIAFKQSKEYSRNSGVVIVAVTALLIGVPQLLWLLLLTPVETASGLLGILTPPIIASLCFAWLTLLNVNRQSQQSSEAELEEVNRAIRLELAAFNQALWLQKRRWGYLLHGTVQAALTVSVARLRHLELNGLNLAGEPINRDDVIETVRTDLKNIESVILNPPDDYIDLDVELEQLAKTWQSVLDITLIFTDTARKITSGNQNLQMAVNEICREAATNSYRHGGATTMTVKIDSVTSKELELTIINNGRAPENVKPGMGLQMLEALAAQWDLRYRRGSGLTTLVATLAVGN
jgi:signal transduction histidine kinase